MASIFKTLSNTSSFVFQVKKMKLILYILLLAVQSSREGPTTTPMPSDYYEDHVSQAKAAGVYDQFLATAATHRENNPKHTWGLYDPAYWGKHAPDAMSESPLNKGGAKRDKARTGNEITPGRVKTTTTDYHHDTETSTEHSRIRQRGNVTKGPSKGHRSG